MGGVMEHIRGGLIDGDGAGVGGGVGLLLTDVELQGLELILTHGETPHSDFLILFSKRKGRWEERSGGTGRIL